MMINLTTRGLSPTDIVEKDSQNIFESMLPSKEAKFTWYSDKYPNLDGHIEFFDEKGSTTVKLFFQLKGRNQDINYYDCDRSFLNYCYKTIDPTFLVFVNIPQQKVYWENINPAYIISVLGIKDIASFKQKTKRITFLKEKTIEQNVSTLIEVCRKHHKEINRINQFNQEAEAKSEPISGQEQVLISIKEAINSTQQQFVDTLNQITPQKELQETSIFNSLKEKFSDLINGLTDKQMLYHAFVYLLKPFYLDNRGKYKRRKLLEFLQITDSEERFIIENLVNADLLGRVGDLVFVTKKEEAIFLLNQYIDEEKLDLEKITQLFSDYENQN